MRPAHRNKQKDILFILISSFVVVVAWVGFNIYHIWATSTVSQDVQAQLTPISPEFDPQTIQELKSRENINPLFESQGMANTSASATIQQSIPTPTSAPLVSGTPTQTPTIQSQITPTNSPINRQGQ